MASKNKKFNVKHMGGNVDRNESEQVTKDYEVRSFAFHRFIASFWNGLVTDTFSPFLFFSSSPSPSSFSFVFRDIICALMGHFVAPVDKRP